MWDKLKEQLNYLKLSKKKLCLVTNSEKFQSKEDFLDAIASSLNGGLDMILFSENSIPDGVIVELGQKIRILCDEFDACLIVDKRVDIAKIIDADGVHLDENDISPEDARLVLGKNAIIGKSVSSKNDIEIAQEQKADFLLIKPDNYNKKTKMQNLEKLKWINENVEIPAFAFDNIPAKDIEIIVQTGIKRVAVSDAIIYSKNPEATVKEFLKHLP